MTVSDHQEKISTAMSGLTAQWGSEVSVVDDRCGGRTVSVPPSLLPAVLVWLRDEPQSRFALLADIVGIDALKLERPDRFEVVYLLRSPGDGELFIVKCSLANDPPHCPSVAGLFGNADWLEREVFDMFGIIFDGHPNLRRLLNHHEFVGHPLRKDYPLEKRQPLSENDTLHDDLQRKLALKSTGGYEIEDFTYETPTTTGERDPYLVNFGPSHPIVHGILRLLLAVEGETIITAASEIGYLHRGAEKGMESGNYHQVIPFTDRLNYASPVMNNIGYCKTIEAMMGITISDYDRLVRIVFLELNRIMDHLLCTGPHLIDLGSLTPFWYLFKVREELYAIFEKISGARLTYSCVRIGALAYPLYDGFSGEVGAALKSLERALDDVRRLIERNRIFHDRCNMVGVMSAAEAISHGFTGPCLRASGVAHDLRKSRPYYGYDEFDFEIVTGSKGDTYDRFFVRILECYESAKIIRQALARLDKLPVDAVSPADGRTSRFPRTIPPAGAFYDATEAANGELGWYVVSDGTANPYRIKVRTPSLNNYCAIEKMAEGIVIADLVAIVGSLNVIGGEIDR